jgi:membrane glycosyltransferase
MLGGRLADVKRRSGNFLRGVGGFADRRRKAGACDGDRREMLGALLMVVVMVLVVPVAIMFGGAIWSALFGWLSSDDADRRHQGDAA